MNEKDFISAIDAGDREIMLPFADWLEERGDVRAVRVRTIYNRNLNWPPAFIEKFEDLVGKTILAFDRSDGDFSTFIVDGARCELYHEQDCCESVYVESINGTFEDLIGQPLVLATENVLDLPPLGEYDESYTWTEFTLATANHRCSIRWYGTSNGYYSESIYFRVTK